VIQGESLGDSTPLSLTLTDTGGILDVTSNARIRHRLRHHSLTITGTAHAINQVLSTLSFTGGSLGLHRAGTGPDHRHRHRIRRLQHLPRCR